MASDVFVHCFLIPAIIEAVLWRYLLLNEHTRRQGLLSVLQSRLSFNAIWTDVLEDKE